MHFATRTALRGARRRSHPPAALAHWERWYERPRFRMWAVSPSIALVACKTERVFRRSMRVFVSSNPLCYHCRQALNIADAFFLDPRPLIHTLLDADLL